MGDVKVRLQFNGDEIFYYPDVLAACGPLNLSDRYLESPKLIVEVLSPSTEAIDRREKALHYRQIQSLEEYVLVAQRAREVTVYRRAEDWEPQLVTESNAPIEFRSVELSMRMAGIYEGVD